MAFSLTNLACRHKAVAVPSPLRSQQASRRQVVAHATFAPPTVADTKALFLANYDKPLPAMYSAVVQELLVTQHFMRHSIKYKYNQIFALGVVSVFNQILDEMAAEPREATFNAYVKALEEEPETYLTDAKKMADLAAECSSPADLKPDADGNEIQKILATIKSDVASGDCTYTRFLAIGLFRLLELTDARDPKALEGLVTSLGLSTDKVNKDLLLYKGILSKMVSAKELMKEFIERETRKTKEREDAKAAKAAGATPEVASS